MKKALIGLLIWSVSSVVLALPFTHGARTNYNQSVFTAHGGSGFVTSSITNSDPNLAAQASSALDAAGATPISLKASAFSSTSLTQTAVAKGIQRYRYTGAGETITANADFSVNFLGGAATTSSFNGFLFLALATIDTYTGDTGLTESDFMSNFEDSSNSLYANLQDYYNFDNSVFDKASTPFTSNTNGASTTPSISVNLTVANGDEFFLFGKLVARGSGGGTADLFSGANGGNVTFNSLTGSLSPVSAVPVPAAIWLMGSALAGLLGFKRKVA